jgi:serine/threonine protein kinase/beta-lactam-binding protein with PASTA domain
MTSTVAPETLLAGRYRLVHRLASGGMGQVWRAADEVLGRPVAVKLLRSELTEDPAFLRRFRIEARSTAALSHPGIASVFDYGETGEPNRTAYLVMELVEGATLSAVLAREGRLGPERALDVVAQAALALGAAHQAGLVHRDVKPSNLLIRRDGVVKVTDFGIARAIGEAPRTEAGLVVGTAAYLSPEQVACLPVTPASDVYALGVVAYECLAGRRPFTGEHPVALALAHQFHAPPPLPPDVPAPVRALVEQAMAKDARKRPTAVALADTAVMARTALLEERHRDARADGNGRPVADRVPGISGSASIVSLTSTNGWSGGNGGHGGDSRPASGSHGAESPLGAKGVRAHVHATDPDQDTGEWMPVSLMRSHAGSRGRRPLAVTAMLAVLAVLATVLTAATTQRVTTIMVPSASGQPITTAAQQLVRAGFVVRERAQPNRSVRAGIVLAQDPAAGRRLERGTLVTLTVSTGPAAVAIDPADYLGQPLDIVRTALIRHGLQVTVETAPSSGEPGTVLGIASSGALRQGDTVTITVAVSPWGSSASAVPSSDGSAPLAQERGKKVERKHRHDNSHSMHR